MQVKDVNYGKTVRKSYAKYQEILQMPNLLKIQKDSYDWFLREGLHEVFRDVAAISDYTGNLELSFLDYSLDEKPKYTIEECKERDATYAKPIKVRVRLLNKQSGEIKDQEIFMGDFPHDQRRHVRHQRCRARHRLPDRPQPRHVLRRYRG